jgi:leucyl aminopeptidase
VYTPLNPAPVPITSSPLESVEADWLFVPVCEAEPAASLAPLDAVSGGEVARAIGSGEFGGKRFESVVLTIPEGRARARRLALVGAGPLFEYSADVVRRVAAAAALLARDRRAGMAAFVHRAAAGGDGAAGIETAAWVQAITEGLTSAEFDVGRYKSAGAETRPPASFAIVMDGPADEAARVAAARGRLVAHCANLARELVNEPGNLLPPPVFVERARELVSGTPLSFEVLDERAIVERGLGLVAGVGQGSRQPPRVMVIRHEPSGAPAAPVLGLVGKGITFDSGGLSIKSADGMERMKDDMAGGAAVVAAMRAIAMLDVPTRVVAVIPAAENMPGGGAMRPGDVLRGGSGRSVEVINTDAEGRLLLADGLWLARQLGATHLADIATLTGACMVALGRSTAGLFGRPDSWRDFVRGVADRSGEAIWPLPLVDDEREQLKSDIADSTNSGSRYGGAVTAALFVGEFAGDCPWAHIDVAGPAWAAEARPFLPKGPTAFGVRTLVGLALAMRT